MSANKGGWNVWTCACGWRLSGPTDLGDNAFTRHVSQCTWGNGPKHRLATMLRGLARRLDGRW